MVRHVRLDNCEGLTDLLTAELEVNADIDVLL